MRASTRRIPFLTALALSAACGSSSSGTSDSAWLRVANLSESYTLIDFCYAPAGTTAWVGPVMRMAGYAQGLVFGPAGAEQVSRAIPVAAGTHDLRVTAAGNAASCGATPLAMLRDVPLAAGSRVLVAAVGSDFVGATAPYQLVTFVDEITGPADALALRFVNAGLARPAFLVEPAGPVDAGIVTASTGYQRIFASVAWPGKAAAGDGVDASGYASVPSALLVDGAALAICPAGATPAGGTCMSATVPWTAATALGKAASAYLVDFVPDFPGAKNFLFCADGEVEPGASSAYSSCALREAASLPAIRTLTEADLATDPALTLAPGRVGVTFLESTNDPGGASGDTGSTGMDVIRMTPAAGGVLRFSFDDPDGSLRRAEVRGAVDGALLAEFSPLMGATTVEVVAPAGQGTIELILYASASHDPSSPAPPETFFVAPGNDPKDLLVSKRCVGCNLEGARLSRANLRNANLESARLVGADLEAADLGYASLKSADLSQAKLLNADLGFANLTGARIAGTTFAGARLRYTTWVDGQRCGYWSVATCER